MSKRKPKVSEFWTLLEKDEIINYSGEYRWEAPILNWFPVVSTEDYGNCIIFMFYNEKSRAYNFQKYYGNINLTNQ